MKARRPKRSTDRLARAWMVALLLVVAGAPAWAAEDEARLEVEEDEELLFMPTLSISFGSYNQSIDGDTRTTSSALPPATGDSLISEFFEFTGRLHTPLKLDDVWSKPQLFLTAGVQIPLAEGLIAERIDENFNRENPPGVPVPGYLDNCPDQISDVFGDPIDTTSCTLTIRNTLTIDAMWNVGVGVDFTFEAFESTFHIMPSFEYYGLAIQVEGEFNRVSTAEFSDDFEELATAVGDPEVFHGVSPSIVLGVDVYEEGPWRWGMFLQGRFVYLLNEPDLAAQGAIGGGDTVFYEAEIDEYIYQVSGGFQVQYTGLD